MFGLPYRLTEDGFEYTYAANYVGHFALVHDLAMTGALSPGARLVATMRWPARSASAAAVDIILLTHTEISLPGWLVPILPKVQLQHDYSRLVLRADDARRRDFEDLARVLSTLPLQ